MTHNQRVLDLLSDGEPHSHLELYDLRVVAHSRVAALRKQGHTIECWRADGLHWYRLNDGALSASDGAMPPMRDHPLAHGGGRDEQGSPANPSEAESASAGQLSFEVAA